MSELAIGCCIASVIISVCALVCGIITASMVIGFKNSTHQVQLFDPSENKTGDDMADEFRKVEEKMNNSGPQHT